MFHWVVMNVFHVSHEIGVVPYQMLPEPALPNHNLTFFLSRWDRSLFAFLSKMPAEIFFDQPYACRNILVFGGQSQNAMEMIGHDYSSIKCKRVI